MDDTYGKNWQNNTSKKEVDFKRQQARSNIDEGLKFLDKTIEYYENLAKEYTSMSERFNKTSVGDISNKDIKAAKELIDAFNRSGRRFE